MCSKRIVHTNKVTINEIVNKGEDQLEVPAHLKKKATILAREEETAVDVKPFTSVHSTKVDFLIYYNNIKDKENCNAFISVKELALLMGLEESTVKFFNCKQKHRLPARVAGRDGDLVWKISTVYRFQRDAAEIIVTPPPPPPAAEEKPQTKSVRGRPTRAVIAAREAAAAAFNT